ncbi:hypothetical protein ACFC09_36280 [Streptomyces sp. NPDC056161]
MDRLQHLNLGLIWLALIAASAAGAGIGALLNRTTTQTARKENEKP